jgi:hypothetical protein
MFANQEAYESLMKVLIKIVNLLASSSLKRKSHTFDGRKKIMYSSQELKPCCPIHSQSLLFYDNWVTDIIYGVLSVLRLITP